MILCMSIKFSLLLAWYEISLYLIKWSYALKWYNSWHARSQFVLASFIYSPVRMVSCCILAFLCSRFSMHMPDTSMLHHANAKSVSSLNMRHNIVLNFIRYLAISHFIPITTNSLLYNTRSNGLGSRSWKVHWIMKNKSINTSQIFRRLIVQPIWILFLLLLELNR